MEDKNQYGMTKLMQMYAADKDLSLEEAKAKLHENAYIRTANETLAKYCRVDENDLDLLRKKVSSLLIDGNPGKKKDSVERKVRSWVNGRAQHIGRESALELAFALHLSAKDAEEMLWRLCGEGFHWRDPQDIVWFYALEHKLGYMEARALSERMASSCQLAPDAKDDFETLTEFILQQIPQIQTEEDLESFLKENAPRLGAFHNTAYALFKDYMELLKTAHLDDSLPEERKMHAGEILSTYLYNNLVPKSGNPAKTEKGGKADRIIKDAIQRDIQRNWPDKFTLSRMSNREADVSRKVLILLFLACDGGDSKYGDYSIESREDEFDDAYARLGSMLSDCGFQPLDARIPFDWMVLYCLAVDDILYIDDKMLGFLSEIFKDPDETGQEP